MAKRADIPALRSSPDAQPEYWDSPDSVRIEGVAVSNVSSAGAKGDATSRVNEPFRGEEQADIEDEEEDFEDVATFIVEVGFNVLQECNSLTMIRVRAVQNSAPEAQCSGITYRTIPTKVQKVV